MLTFIKRNLRFSEFTGVNLLSKIGDRLFYTAMLTLASGLPQASIAVTIVSISETLPVLLGFALGSIADQQSHKFMKMIQNTLIRAVLYIAIGFALNYSKTLQLFLIMAILNFISDVLGNYSSALSAPFTKLLVNQEDMEQAQGLVSITAQAVNVLATFCGSLLLSLFVANKIAYLNAGVFIIVAILYTILRPKFKNVEKSIPSNTSTSVTKMILQNVKALFRSRVIVNDLCQLALINGFFGGITPIFVLFLNHSNTIFFSKAITISLLSSLVTVFMILGNELSPKIFHNVATSNLNIISNIFIMITAYGLFIGNLYLVLVAASIVALMLGLVSPRFSSRIINQFPTERLGGIVTTVNSILTITPPLTSFLFPVLTNFGLRFSYGCLFAYGVLLLIMSFGLLHTN